jgi:alanyl-tRNA synthetase
LQQRVLGEAGHPFLYGGSKKPNRINNMTSLRDIRRDFLSFFEGHGHAIAPSSPLVPKDDPTLLFTNAGMVQFKNVFTGQEKRTPPRAVTTQKCVRAGGKHNDLDNVGYTARHHTFFEMLGNFSFGDYFKEDAIAYAWNLITRDFGLDASKLLVTIYADDKEAGALWKKIAGLSDDRIIPIATSDNFWMMGDTGPCGPCSEIFFDHGSDIAGGPPGSPDEDGDRFIEIWNLVFMQFEQQANGDRINLPKPSIDTGMGLERIAAVLQGVHNNYEIDLFKALIANSEDVLSSKAAGDALASHRVIADHLRSSAFLMADGVSPSNEGRGYVLRRIMRRAMRHAHLLGASEPVMYCLVGELVNQMGDAFPELGRAQSSIEATLEAEEERFQRTLGRGLALLDEASAGMKPGDALAGETAFKLYDTYGFPLDLTQDALRARGMSVDEDGFETAMEKQRAMARAAGFTSGEAAPDTVWFDVREQAGATEFLGYDTTEAIASLIAMVAGGGVAEQLGAGQSAELVFDRSPFYGESGGQIGDAGIITFESGAEFRVHDVQKRTGDVFAHIGLLESGSITLDDTAQLTVDRARRDRTRANHSATHLMHRALRDVLGDHVSQKGSYVGPDRLRFDFSSNGAVSPEQIGRIEAAVNAVIRQNVEVLTQEMSPDEAIEAGALALFGEKYGDRVRVLTMGVDPDVSDTPYSVELCGGTHVSRTGDIALFKIVGEGAVSAGVRRIEALTGEAARQWLDEQAALARQSADALKVPAHDVPARIKTLIDDRKQLERQLADAKKQLAMGGGGNSAPSAPEQIGDINFVGRVAEGVGGRDLRGLIDDAKSRMGSGVAVFIGVNDGKASLAVGVTDDLTDRFDAVALVKAGAEAVGGKGGGGRADFAQAGGPEGASAQSALDAIKAVIAG